VTGVDQIFDLETAEGDAFAGLANVSDGFRDRPLALGWGEIVPLGEGFQGMVDDFFVRIGVRGTI
jgi:hypothetical protein